ncbi:MAG: AAA family ATPase [Phycisphaerae bacterium]|nr:AAA family ATPase [Phycisphaerae bacterium]
MRTIAVLNQKGGVGKTTTVVNLAAALAMKGQRVMVIDLDPQAHLTIHFGVDAETDGHGAYEVLTKSADMSNALVNVRGNVWLLGANINLVGAESELVSVVGRETVLREALESLTESFDYVIIDCPPALGLLTLNALAAVKEVFIPVQPHFLALQGFSKLLQTVSLVGRRINPDLRVAAIVLCMFDTRVTLSSEVKADIKNFLDNARTAATPWSGARIIPIHIRQNIKLAEAPSHGQTIFEYEPKCNGAIDYERVADYVHNYMNGEAADEAFLASISEEINELDTTLASVGAAIQAAQEEQNVAAEPSLESAESAEPMVSGEFAPPLDSAQAAESIPSPEPAVCLERPEGDENSEPARESAAPAVAPPPARIQPPSPGSRRRIVAVAAAPQRRMLNRRTFARSLRK